MTPRKSLLKTILSALTAVTLAGCGAHATPGVARLPASAADGLLGSLALKASKPGQMSMFVMPDAGPKPLLDAIAGAKKSIKLELYMLTYSDISKQITDALVAKSKEPGVDVQVILEDHPYTGANPTGVNINAAALAVLVAGGVHTAHSSPRFVYTHEKAMVVDGQVAYIMTMNMSSTAFTKNREYVIADSSPSDVAEVSRIFDADWEQKPVVAHDPDLVVSPDNSRKRILGLIDRAKQSLVVESEFLDDPEVIQHIGQAQTARHVAVNVMLSYQAPGKTYDANAREGGVLATAGLTNVTFTHTVTMHAKAVIVDSAVAYVGSENLTTNSLDKNREMGVIVTDPALVAKLVSITDLDWKANLPVAAPAPAVAPAVAPAAK